MENLFELVRAVTNPILSDPNGLTRLFLTAYGFTLVTHLLTVPYLKGVLGLASSVEQLPGWDSEIENWILWILGALAALIGWLLIPVEVTVALIVAVILTMIVLYWSLYKLMTHDLPSWLVAILMTILIGVPLIVAFLVFVAGSAVTTPAGGTLESIISFLVVMLWVALVVAAIIALYKLARAVKRNIIDPIWNWLFPSPPGADDVITRPADVTADSPSVSNPIGAAPDDNISNPGRAAVIPPESCITVDFHSPVIRDHLNASDIRIQRAPGDQDITVEVSNDKVNWEQCERDAASPAPYDDYDVPYWNSPWRYVRICNRGSQPISVWGVYDLY